MDGEGSEFVRFMRELIRASALAHGGEDADIHVSGPIKAKDGGVDASVRRVPHAVADPSGWLSVPTVWQFKAERKPLTEALLRRETSKPLVRRHIRRGYGYRFCAAREVTDAEGLEETLRRIVDEIKPGAVEPRVLTADRLARWVERFPALVQRWFTPDLEAWQDHKTWERRELASAPRYQPVKAWAAFTQRIQEHARPASRDPNPVLSLRGLAGVGKTRLVLESLRPLAPLVAYTRNAAEVIAYANQLEMEGARTAVLVVDECSPEIADRLRYTLAPAADRVRVITVGNDLEPLRVGDRLWLERMSDDDLAGILSANFEDLADDVRARVVAVARGFVRLAIDMGHEARRSADPRALLENVERYLDTRFERRPTWRRALLLASLVTHVGFGGVAREELPGLCEACGEDPREIRAALDELHQRVGFVGVAGGSFYVTPEAVASTAFEMAWRRYAAAAPEDFVARLPATLFERFQRRAEHCASKEVRESIAATFHAWAAALTPASLVATKAARSLAHLVSMDPRAFLPVVTHLVARPDAVALIEAAPHGLRWAERHELASLLGRGSRYPEFFDEAEAGLRRLALIERARGLPDNAYGAWLTLFRPALSNTGVPFEARLARLRRLSGDPGEEALHLYADALDHALHRAPIGLERQPFAGLAPPEEWNPRSWDELDRCRHALHSALVDLAKDERPGAGARARAIAASHARDLLSEGALDVLVAIFPPGVAAPGEIKTLTRSVESFLRFDADGFETSGDSGYVSAVRAWFAHVSSADFRARLVTLASSDPWLRDDRKTDPARTAALGELATEMASDRGALREALLVLRGAPFHGVTQLARAFADRDEGGARLAEVLDERVGGSAFACGYVAALLDAHPEQEPTVNAALDSLGEREPALAVQVARVHPLALRFAERLVRFVETGALSVKHLEMLRLAGLAALHGEAAVARVLDLLADRAVTDAAAARVAVDLLGALAEDPSPADAWPASWVDRALGLLEHALHRGAAGDEAWGVALARVVRAAPERALALASRALTALEHRAWAGAGAAISAVADAEPVAAVEALGAALLDRRGGARVAVYREVVASIPAAAWGEWLDREGVAGARALARHLPRPFVESGSGTPRVPELTALVLRRFDHDDEVFHAFCTGARSLRAKAGDIAAEFDRDAEEAAAFLRDPIPRVRQWAREEIENARAHGRSWRDLRVLEALR